MKENQFTCDNCGGVIEDIADGWLEWLEPIANEHDGKGRGLRIVHHNIECQYVSGSEYEDGWHLKDGELSWYTGPNGLMRLLSKLSIGILPTEDVLEIIKRLHVPGYEQARLSFDTAIDQGVFEPNTLPRYYWQSDIKAVLSWLNSTQ